MSTTITLISKEETRIPVERKIIELSTTLKHMLEDAGNDLHELVLDMDSETILKIIQYYEWYLVTPGR